MNYLGTLNPIRLAIVFCLVAAAVSCQQQQPQAQPLQQPNYEQLNFPYYLQSPLSEGNPGQAQQVQQQQQQQQQQLQETPIEQQQQANGSLQQLMSEDQLTQRSSVAGPQRPKGRPFGPPHGLGNARKLQMEPPPLGAPAGANLTLQQASELASVTLVAGKDSCLYEKRYFSKLDECLAKRPYPTIGLPAFKNEDLLIKRGLSDRHGCVFILNSGLFKSYQLARYSVDSDSQCLDGGKVGLSMSFSNVTLSYLWTLRCLNRADQLLDDATLDGTTTVAGALESELLNVGQSSSSSLINGAQQAKGGFCVGSSQSFGFTSLQLTNIEAQVELAADIFKNWRLTNVTVAMVSPSLSAAVVAASARSTSETSAEAANLAEAPVLGTNIKDFVFESLDGDELNWRYLHLFQNWARNRMHANFLEQYKRFLWISLQRCLSESSERLPVKLIDVFNSQRLN